MAKYYICEIGSKANKNLHKHDFDKWIDRAIRYIKVYIDKDFDQKKFMKWLQEDGDEPFIFGKNRYFW